MEETYQKKWYQKWWGIILLIILVGLFVAGLVFGWQVLSNYQMLQQGLPALSELQTNQNISGVVNVNGEYIIVPTIDDDPSLGPKDAAVTVISFQDFQCPYCQEQFSAWRETINKYQDRVLFVFRDFAPPPSFHPLSQTAALAAECAHDQNKFWEMHDLIFTRADQLSADNLKVWASQIGLDMAIFNHCFTTEKHSGEIQKDLQDAQYGGVSGTPTFFINGYRISGVISAEAWSKILDYLL